jgi:hypothetical protein
LADLTASGRPADKAALEIKIRRMRLDVRQKELQIERNEVEILERLEQNRRTAESNAGILVENEKLRAEIALLEAGNG